MIETCVVEPVSRINMKYFDEFIKNALTIKMSNLDFVKKVNLHKLITEIINPIISSNLEQIAIRINHYAQEERNGNPPDVYMEIVGSGIFKDIFDLYEKENTLEVASLPLEISSIFFSKYKATDKEQKSAT